MITIRSLGHKGEGVGTDSGLVVFVEGALPGETVEVRLIEKKKRFARGELLKIIDPSPHRVDPPCPIYSRCGGCQLMHLSYPEQLKAKTERVRDALRKILHSETQVNACLPSPREFNWRHKVQLPAEVIDGKTVFGFYEAGSHRLVPVSSCMIHAEGGNTVLQTVESHVNKLNITLRHILLKSSRYSGKTLVILITDGSEKEKIRSLASIIMEESPQIAGVILNVNTRTDNVILGRHFETIKGESFLIEELAGCQFIISPGSFFQVNPQQAEAMYQTIVDFAELSTASSVLDAYCGVGTMAIIAAKKAGKVLGIECVEEAVSDARENARLNDIENASFVKGVLENYDFKGKSFDTVLLNPPRKGCEIAALQKIIKLKPKRIVYASCDPATLARDLSVLGYRIDEVQPFDMFPQTMHVETVVKLTLS